MKQIKLDVTTLKTEQKDFGELVSKLALSSVFLDRESSINEMMMFLLYFNAIPNIIEEEEINCKKANEWFLKNYQSKIRYHHYFKRYDRRKKSAELDDVFYILDNDVLVDFDTSQSEVRFLFSSSTDVSIVEKIMADIRKFRKRIQREKPKISILVNSSGGFYLQELDLSKSLMNIENNYNDDFQEIHSIILKRLSTKNDKGLVLLHGQPGTGKTSYVHYLISKIKKHVIFLPPSMAEMITSPSLMAVLIENPNSVLVIEDAENIIIDRERDGNSPVSALLNLSDGLLSNCLNIQIICSFNTDLSKVDRALLRKGRLIAKYEFKELEISKAQQLSDKLGFNILIDQPMSLTDIYNQEERDFKPTSKTRKIGF